MVLNFGPLQDDAKQLSKPFHKGSEGFAFFFSYVNQWYRGNVVRSASGELSGEFAYQHLKAINRIWQ